MRDVLAAEHPDAVVSISSDVLREYREYERSMTTLVDAAVKPRVARYVAGIAERLAGLRAADDPRGAGARSPIMKSNGGVLSAAEIVHQPITTVLSGPAAGRARRRAGRPHRRASTRCSRCDGGGTSTDVSVVLGRRADDHHRGHRSAPTRAGSR